jgi:hypothetical protein
VIAPRLFACSGAKIAAADPVAAGRLCVELDSIGNKPNVHIRFENVARVFRQNLSPRLIDFLEIVSYVFTADCATSRGKKWTDDYSTEPWGRDFAFVIPVREPDFWDAAKIKGLIEEVLGFLSNDKSSFTFVPLERDRADQQPYFEFGDIKDWPFHRPERVVMFSGGLDSLAGAVDTAMADAKTVLVSHRPVSTLDSRQKKLVTELQRLFPDQLIHIPVWINKAESFGREPTQRTRSFLYSALGAVVAQSVQAGGVRFYENGIVSLNLPIAQEALRARASRTTHPVALHLLASLCAAVIERDFTLDNPYLFKTKAEVVATLATHRAAHLIADTCSCSHSMFQSKTQRHCGRCSQCIDRRFATTAADLLAYDSETDYVSDVFVGPRKDALERAIAVDYTRHGIELHRRSETELAAIFNAELSRAVRYEAKRSEVAERIISMHKRHGEVVTRVLEQKVAENAGKLVGGNLDGTSLLALALGPEHLRQHHQLSTQAREPGSAESDSTVESPQSQGAALARVEETLGTILAKLGVSAPEGIKAKKKRKPGKRDTIIFAAILMELKGMKYCSFLQDHGIKPKWSESGPDTYPRGYQAGDPWRKRVQDEKTRAKVRMNKYADSELATALNNYLPDEFDKINPLLHSRNSPDASKTSTP